MGSGYTSRIRMTPQGTRAPLAERSLFAICDGPHQRPGLYACAAVLAVLLATSGCALGGLTGHGYSPARLTSRTLQPFRDTAEFEAYRARLHKVARDYDLWWAARGGPGPAGVQLSEIDEEPCDPATEPCPELQEVVVTANVAAPSPVSITNNQMAGVDEGDVVKKVGRHLIVLQHGRLFSIDTGNAPGALTLVDRLNVYRSKSDDTWYDELLVFGRKLLVIGFSWREQQTEISIFSLDDRGRIEPEAIWHIESNDYYSAENYAGRLVDGHLVLYTPIDLTHVDPEKHLAVPRIRRWSPASGHSAWTPLFRIEDVYKPIQQTLTPTLHVVSVCPMATEADLACHSRGIVAPLYSELYVSPDNAYLWITSDVSEWGFGRHGPLDCLEDSPAPAASAVYRLPLFGTSLTALRTHGSAPNQFVFEEREGRLHALLAWLPATCWWRAETDEVRFVTISASAFGPAPRTLSHDRYRAVPPAADALELQARYTPRHVLYGDAQGKWRAYWPTGSGQTYEPGALHVVPLADPDAAHTVLLDHSVERIERLGDEAAVFGYASTSDFGVSTLRPGRDTTRAADTLILQGVAEAEGRSHAFNAVTYGGGNLFGLPTVLLRDIHRGRVSDAPVGIHFFRTDKGLVISTAGHLSNDPTAEDPDYQCEVSCIDWYGNARPIFFDGRVFALMGSELVEGESLAGDVVELYRIRLTGPPLIVQ